MNRLSLLTAFATLTFAASAGAQTIAVDQPWARATSPSQSVGGAFLTITDNGADDALVSAASPIAASVELHETVNDNGVMGLKQQLKPGDSFPLTLNFAHAAPMTVNVVVQSAGAAAPAMDMGGMDHSHMHMDHSGMSMPMQSKP